jgi:hypothetical protein
MRGPRPSRVVLALLTGSLVGCGGNGSDDVPGVLGVAAAADGLFRSDLSIDDASVTQKIAVGADGVNFVHGWIRFIHAPTTIALVGDGVVTNVTLRISKVFGAGDPETEHPTVTLSHTDFGDLIQGSDYALVGTPVAGGAFTPTGTGIQEFVFDVTSQVLADINGGSTTSDFYLSTSGVQTDNSYWIFEDEDPPFSPDEPHLSFRYTP